MVERNDRIRWCNNNLTEAADTTVTVSSEQALFPASNLQIPQRYKPWSPSGNFVVSSVSTKNEIYINDGADKTVTITPSSYTPSQLATEIATQLNTVSSLWSCTYTGSRFTISRSSGTATLRFSGQPLIMWESIGFLSTTDRSGLLSYSAEEIRIHSYETVDWDLGAQRPITFFSIISKKSEQFTLSTSAVLTLRGDNIPPVIGTTAAFERIVTVGDEGVFEFLDDTADTSFRYWQLVVQDKTNPLGSTALKFGVIYLGDYLTLSARGLARGFTKKKIDPSLKNTAESGAVYYKIKNKYWTFTGLSTQYLKDADRKDLEQFFEDVGNHAPFFISLDPTLCVSTKLSELTKYVRFEGDPSLVHVKTDTYSMGFNVREDL